MKGKAVSGTQIPFIFAVRNPCESVALIAPSCPLKRNHKMRQKSPLKLPFNHMKEQPFSFRPLFFSLFIFSPLLHLNLQSQLLLLVILFILQSWGKPKKKKWCKWEHDRTQTSGARVTQLLSSTWLLFLYQFSD